MHYGQVSESTNMGSLSSITCKQKEHTCWFGILVESVDKLGCKSLIGVILGVAVDARLCIQFMGCTVTTLTFGCPDFRVLYNTVTCSVLQTRYHLPTDWMLSYTRQQLNIHVTTQTGQRNCWSALCFAGKSSRAIPDAGSGVVAM
jgi:hypothetical protein